MASNPAQNANHYVHPLDVAISNGRCIIHFRYRTAGTPDSAVELINILNTSLSSILNIQSSGTSWVVRRGGTALFTVAAAYTANVWAHYIIDVTIAGGTDGAVTIYRDGSVIASQSSLNTQNVSGNVGAIRFQNNRNRTTDYDDIYVDDTDVRGQLQVTYATVDSDVAITGWSGGYEDLDDVPDDGDTSFSASSTDTDSSRHGITPALAGRQIFAVQPVVVARVEEASSSEIHLTLHSGSSDDGGRGHVMTTGPRGYVGVLSTTDPDTTDPWDAGDLDAAEVEFVHVIP